MHQFQFIDICICRKTLWVLCSSAAAALPTLSFPRQVSPEGNSNPILKYLCTTGGKIFQPKISFLSNTSNFASKETGNLFEELRPLCEKSEIARSENSISFIANAELKVFSEEKGWYLTVSFQMHFEELEVFDASASSSSSGRSSEASLDRMRESFKTFGMENQCSCRMKNAQFCRGFFKWAFHCVVLLLLRLRRVATTAPMHFECSFSNSPPTTSINTHTHSRTYCIIKPYAN